MEYHIRLEEEIELLTGGNRTVVGLDDCSIVKILQVHFSFKNKFASLQKSYVAVEVDGKETPCLIHVYNSENEKCWRETTTILSRLSLDGRHDRILPFLWCAKGIFLLLEFWLF